MAKKLPKATKIMLLRHAEKPDKDGAPFGVTRDGKNSTESLAVRGWERAGALTILLAPADGHFQNSALAKPQYLFTSKPLKRKGSRRPIETITPLSEKLALEINSEFQRADYEEMVELVFSCSGVVLICWQREYIPEIAATILGNEKTSPSAWPEDRFDLIWVFDLDRRSGRYSFRQVPQMLLAGDSRSPIRR
jgi:hypothetical protein